MIDTAPPPFALAIMTAALLIAAAVAFAPADSPQAETLTPGEWPMFRGPNGAGVGADPLPADLIRPENLRWQVDVPGRGWGSPVVADGPQGPTVYVPTATPDGRQMDMLAYDLATGERRWIRKLFRNSDPDFCHPTNTYASCTPVATKEAVFAHFGKYGTARLDPANGHVVWERRDFECNHFRGPASSPLLVQIDGLSPRLIVPFDGVDDDDQYVVALDAATGKTLWQYDRKLPPGTIPDKRKAYGTPALMSFENEPVVVTTGADATVALHPENRQVVWRIEHGGMNTGSVPQVSKTARRTLIPPGGQAFFTVTDYPVITTGDAPTSVAMLNPLEEQASTNQEEIVWSSNRAAPRRTTPVLGGGRSLFTVDDDGVAAIIAIDDGAVEDRVRLGDSYWSSPVRAGETMFTFGKEGTAATLTATDAGELSVADKQKLDEGVWATPALAGGGLVLRTEHTLRFYHPDGTTK